MRSLFFAATAGAVLAAAPVSAATIFGVDGANNLITFNSAAPGVTLTTVGITGLGTSAVSGIDFRPANGQLYALSSDARLFTVNTLTGAATQVGSSGGFTLSGSSFGFDFNPVVDRIRVVSNTGQNFRLNPDTGGVGGSDTSLAYANSDPGAGVTPSVTGIAYSNNFTGAATTTLYGLDTARNTLVTIGSPNGTPTSPNAGVMYTVGQLGITLASNTGFDISTTGEAFFSSGTGFYSINLTTGAATQLGTTTALRGLTIGADAPTAPVPEPASWAMLATGFALVGSAIRRRRARLSVPA